MSLFTVGKRYQGEYTVEHVVSFFNGELAISQFLDDQYYLHSVPLVREFTTLEFHRFKKLYDELDLELLLPVSDMFLEGNHAVFVYPYEPIQPIRDAILSTGVSDESMISWFHKIVQTEIVLQSMGIPMYIIRDPRNIGLNAQGELRIIFTAIEDVMLYESTINWGTFFYCIATGEYVEESLKRLPSKHSISRPVARVIQKSFRAKTLQDLYSIVDQAMKRIQGGGLIGSLFGKKKKEETPANSNLQIGNEGFTIESNQDPFANEVQQYDQLSEHQEGQDQNQIQNQSTFDWSKPLEEQQIQDNVSMQKEALQPEQQTGQVNELDPFEQQLEEMYQAIEQENQAQQKSPQTSLDDTLVVTNQDPNIDLGHQQALPENQLADSQITHSNTSNPSDEITQIYTSQDQLEPQNQTQGFVRKSSQESPPAMDETQIFSASDLASLEAELEALQQEREAKQHEQTNQDQLEQQEQQPTVEQSQSDELTQLESLFNELEQLQQSDQTFVANQDSSNEQELTVATAESQVTDDKVVQEQSTADLDLKVKELESLFDELNQIQSTGTKATSIKESTDAIPATQQEAVKEEKTEVDLKQEEPAVSSAQEAEEEKQQPQEEDPLEKIRREFELEQQALLERQRQKLQERQQALINEAQEELKKRQQELLKEMEKQEQEMLAKLEEKFQKRKLEEMRRIELNTLRKKHDQEVAKGIEEIRKEYQELEKLKLEELDQEFAIRKQEIIDQLNEKRVEQEREFKDQKEKEWQELLKKFEEEETTDEGEQIEGSAEKKEPQLDKDQDSKKSQKKGKKSDRKKEDAKKKNKEVVKKHQQKKKDKNEKKKLSSQLAENQTDLKSEIEKKEKSVVTAKNTSNE